MITFTEIKKERKPLNPSSLKPRDLFKKVEAVNDIATFTPACRKVAVYVDIDGLSVRKVDGSAAFYDWDSFISIVFADYSDDVIECMVLKMTYCEMGRFWYIKTDDVSISFEVWNQ